MKVLHLLGEVLCDHPVYMRLPRSGQRDDQGREEGHRDNSSVVHIILNTLYLKSSTNLSPMKASILLSAQSHWLTDCKFCIQLHW